MNERLSAAPQEGRGGSSDKGDRAEASPVAPSGTEAGGGSMDFKQAQALQNFQHGMENQSEGHQVEEHEDNS